jgi:hypothetical protein
MSPDGLDPSAMKIRRLAFVLAKIVFATLVIWWLFHKVDVARVWADVRNAHLAPVFVGAVLMLMTIAIAGWRWSVLLRIFGIEIPLKSLICVAQVGQFFTMFLPGPTGDDLTRIVYISRLAPGRVGEACTSVLFDRCIGLASVLLLALFCIPFHWHLLSERRQTYALAVAMLVGGGIVCIWGAVFLLWKHPGSSGFFGRLARLLPESKLRNELLRISGLLAANRIAVVKVVTAAVGTQLLLCTVYALAGTAVGIQVPIFTWFGFVPIIIAANAFPVTVAGIGVRDYLFVLFLEVLAKVKGESALAASFLVLAITLAVCLLGGLVYILYRPKRIEPHIP